jgi:hypothetical protein
VVIVPGNAEHGIVSSGEKETQVFLDVPDDSIWRCCLSILSRTDEKLAMTVDLA